MKLQKIVSHLQKLHPKEIDLSLDRIKILCEKLGNPQDKLKANVNVGGTNMAPDYSKWRQYLER